MGNGIIYRLRRSLANLLDPDAEGLPATQRTTPPVGAPPSDLDTRFVSQLKAMLGQPGQGALLSSRINVIGLQKVKEKIGAAWERVAERADRVARRTIERHLEPGDIYTRLKSETYVVVFAHLSHAQAKAKSTLIGHEIAKALLGEPETELLEVKTAVAKIDSAFQVKPIASSKQLGEALSCGNDIEFIEMGEEAPPAAKPRRSPQDVLANLQFAYRPIWDQARNAISTYLCTAQVPLSDVGSALGDAELMMMGSKDTELAQFDDAVRERVLDDLQQLMREKRKLLLTLPVHFETLGPAARRRQYFDTLKQFLGAEAGKFLVVELIGLPPGVQRSRLLDLITPLRQMCRSVMVRVPFETTDFTHIKDSGAAAVGCDIAVQIAPEVNLMQQMNRFNRGGVGAAVPTYLQGANTLSQVAAAVGAGFAYIGGDGVAKLVDHPRSVVDFHLTDLYRSFIKN